MADFEPIIPGGGIVNDTEEGSVPVIPALGLYQEQAAAAAGISVPVAMHHIKLMRS